MKLIVHGALGHMGQLMCAEIEAAEGMEVAARPDGAPVIDYDGEADCLIDFSHHSATDTVLNYCLARKLPAVIATTGQTEEEKAKILAASRSIPVFFAANLSVGVALLCELAGRAAAMFPDADIEIIEIHHNRKVDVPSGTALMLAKSIQKVREEATLLVGRHENGKRTKQEIGIHSLRLGNEVGTHEIRISNGSETITLRHEAENRSLFAKGALAAARYLVGQQPGLYDMQTMLGKDRP